MGKIVWWELGLRPVYTPIRQGSGWRGSNVSDNIFDEMILLHYIFLNMFDLLIICIDLS